MASILIIDDDHGMCYTLSNIVKHQGHDVVCAHSVKEGQTEAKSRLFDIVFLDVMMPGVDGTEIADQLKNEEEFLEVSVERARESQRDSADR